MFFEKMDLGASTLSERCLLPGANASANAHSLNLGFQRLLASGCGSSVIVTELSCVEGEPLAVLATLDGHPGTVCCCRWSSRPLDNNLDNPYRLMLASGDDKGSVMIWSVLEGQAELHLTDTPAGAVLDMCWHPENHSLLLTLRERNVLALWDTSGGSCLWRCVVKNVEDLLHMSFNASPFSLPLRDVFFASRKGSIYWLSDVDAGSSTELVLKYKILGPDPKSSFCGMQMYSAVPNCVLFVLSREVLVFDMTMQHAVGGFTLERGLTNLVSISAGTQLGVVWALHEDGRISLWRAQAPSYLVFSLMGSSSQLRFAKTRRQDAVPIVSIQSRGASDALSCVAMDRLGSLFAWVLDAGTNSLQVEEMRHTFSSNISSFGLHPVAGARQLACGTTHGTLVLADGVSRRILREFLIESGQVIRGVQWFGTKHVLLFVVQEVQADMVFVNSVLKVDVSSGAILPLLQSKRAEPTQVRMVKLSPSGRYMLVLRRERPVELWDVSGQTAIHLGNIKPYIQVNALCWRTPAADESAASTADEFAASTADNMLRTFRVEQSKLVVVRQQDALTVYPISCICWRGDVLVTGDSTGGMSLFDWKRKVCWSVNLRGAAIAELQLNRTNATVLVVFGSGGVCIYDVSVKRQVNDSTLLSVRNLRVIGECSWWHECPVLLCSDGCLRVMDANLGSCNTPLIVSSLASLSTPFLLETRRALALKVKMLRSTGDLTDDTGLAVPVRLVAGLAACGSYGERALTVARYFGDSWEEKVWQLVLAMAPHDAQEQAPNQVLKAVAAEEVPAFLRQNSLLSAAKAQQPVAVQSTRTTALPSSFGLIRTEAEVREQFEAQSAALERRRNMSDVTTHHLVARRFIWSGDSHSAIAVLSNADPESPSFQVDSLLSCLVAASAGPEYFERTTKSAATGLIARGDVDLGVQLLVLVGRANEACRYLLENGRYEEAVRLAKLQPLHVMSESDKHDLYRKWCEHLSGSQKNWREACLVWLSMGGVSRAVALLHSTDRFQVAVGLLQHFASSSSAEVPDALAVQGLHLDYGFFLHRLGLELDAAQQFQLAGPAGAAMAEAISSAPFELRGSSRGRSGSGIVSAGGKRGIFGRVAENLKEEIQTLTKKEVKK